MSFGFLGIQFGFALQGAFMSRIFQTLGADAANVDAVIIANPKPDLYNPNIMAWALILQFQRT